MKKLPEPGPRDATIRKSNELIQRYHFGLTLQQQKIILFLISKIQPWDNDFQKYELKISDFYHIYGLEPGGNSYENLKYAVKSLADLSYWKEFPDGREKLLRWIEFPEIDRQNGIISVKLDPSMKPFLLQLKANFTKYELWNTLLFRSRYSLRLYELVRSLHYHDLKPYQRTFTVSELRKLMGISDGTYKQIKDFEQRVLKPALREVNELTDELVTVQQERGGKTGYYVTGYNLTITSKSYGEIAACRARVERELGAEQLTLWESIAARLTAEANSDPSGGGYVPGMP